MPDARHILGSTNVELARFDPVGLNLWIASGVPQLADLDIAHYQRVVDGYAKDVTAWIKHFEPQFHENPSAWQNDLHFFGLGILCRYIEEKLGIAYKEDQKHAKSVRYTNPSDLFLNGVIDTKRGTCGNMAALQLAIGWRLGWPVSLACAWTHLFMRYDNGLVQYNVEATRTGFGGMSAPPNEYYVKEFNLPPEAVQTGSDLRAVTPREMLGIFVGLRARHFRDIGDMVRAESDYSLARWLFPKNRSLYTEAMGVSVLRGMSLFHINDYGSPYNLAEWIRGQYREQRA